MNMPLITWMSVVYNLLLAVRQWSRTHSANWCWTQLKMRHERDIRREDSWKKDGFAPIYKMIDIDTNTTWLFIQFSWNLSSNVSTWHTQCWCIMFTTMLHISHAYTHILGFSPHSISYTRFWCECYAWTIRESRHPCDIFGSSPQKNPCQYGVC